MPWQKISERLGIEEGGPVRTLAGNILSALGLDRLVRPDPAERSVAFTIAFIALSAKLSKADGVSLQIEAEAFERIYHVPEPERRNVRRLYDLAKQDVAGFESYAHQIAKAMAKEPELRRHVLEALFHVATADGLLHPTEDSYLARVAEIFGLSDAEYRAIRAAFVHDEADPYQCLGVPHDISDEDLKSYYRRLVRENHPDTLIAQGVPGEFIDVASARLAALNAAYEAICKERGL